MVLNEDVETFILHLLQVFLHIVVAPRQANEEDDQEPHRASHGILSVLFGLLHVEGTLGLVLNVSPLGPDCLFTVYVH